MALPAPGNPISISQIRTELGSSSGSLRTLSSLAGFSTPDAMSEFYSYSANAVLYYTYEAYSSGYQEANVYYNGGSVTMTSSGNSDGPIFLSPSSQVISADAYESNGFGATINYELNDVFQAYYSEPYLVSTPNINTSSGNTYFFGIVTGAF